MEFVFVYIHECFAGKAMHLPFPSRHDDGNDMFSSRNIPGTRVGDLNFLLNNSSLIPLLLCVLRFLPMSHSLMPSRPAGASSKNSFLKRVL